MATVRHVLLLILAYLLQTTWAHLLEVAALKPDLVLLVLVQIALRSGPVEGALLGFGIGLLQDLQMPADLGLNALVKTAAGFAAGYCRTGITADSIQVQVGLMLGTVLVHDLVFYLGSSGVTWVEVPYFWCRYSLGRAAYTGLIGALVYAALLLRSHFSPVTRD